MKVLFLDFDGVLNSRRYLRTADPYGVALDPTRMELLGQIVAATDARIVLTTSWRVHWEPDPATCNDTGREIHAIFARHGLSILDKTPQLPQGREQEIRCWLEQHPETTAYVVLDDRLLGADFLADHFVMTANHRDGLDQADVQKTITLLNTI